MFEKPKKANQFLPFKQKRSSDALFLEEIWYNADLEQECFEETCDQSELLEAINFIYENNDKEFFKTTISEPIIKSVGALEYENLKAKFVTEMETEATKSNKDQLLELAKI
mgnify:FL=1